MIIQKKFLFNIYKKMVKKEFKIKEGTFTAYSKRKGKTVPQMTRIVLKNPSKYNTFN